jgi:hypothetical protein
LGSCIVTIEKQKETLDKFTERMKTVLISKGDDYANIDRLSNFKLGGAIVGLTPSQHCMALIATKIVRLGVLLASGATPNNESIDDNILDLANYSALLHMIQTEKQDV